jgi:hypothetical protein
VPKKYRPIAELPPEKQAELRARWQRAAKPFKERTPEQQAKIRARWRKQEDDRRAMRAHSRDRHAGLGLELAGQGLSIVSEREIERPTYRILRGDTYEVECWLKADAVPRDAAPAPGAADEEPAAPESAHAPGQTAAAESAPPANHAMPDELL